MELTDLLPLIAGGFFVIYGVILAVTDRKFIQKAWLFPAVLSFFFAFSVYTITQEGLLGFWPEHAGTFWENQITFDLLLAVGVAWFFVVPKAKALGMKPLLWFVFIMSTGSIGLLATVSRVLYLQEKRA